MCFDRFAWFFTTSVTSYPSHNTLPQIFDLYTYLTLKNGVDDPALRQGFIQMVQRRDARTLLPIIQRVVAPGTTVWSDEWRAYAQLAGLGYVHQTVNHSQNFTDPVTGVCTNHVEAYWCAVKRRFKKMIGTASGMVPSYLDEHMWRERYGRTPALCFVNIQRHIQERYPLP